jgi:hypothetical protein
VQLVITHGRDSGRDIPAPLSDEIMSQAQDLPPPPVFQDVVPSTDSTASAQAGSSSEKKIPKWLKVGSKLCADLQDGLVLNFIQRSNVASPSPYIEVQLKYITLLRDSQLLSSSHLPRTITQP